LDDEGRWIRSRSSAPRNDSNDDGDDGGGWDDVDDGFKGTERSRSSSNGGGGGGWDNFEPFSSVSITRPSRSTSPPRTRSSSGSGRGRSSPSRPPQKNRDDSYGDDRGYGNSNWQDENTRRPSSSMRRYGAESNWRNEDPNRNPYPKGRGGGGGERGRGRERERFNRNRDESSSSADDADRKINMRALEGAGFVHLYGLAPVLNALHANRRDFSRPEDRIIDLDLLQQEGNDPEALEHELKQRERKPEAQFSPCLFVLEQEYHMAAAAAGTARKGRRSADKARQAQQVQELARKRGLAIAPVDKGVLNTLSQNRPHQGYVLRCGQLDFEPLSRIPHADKMTTNDSDDDSTETSSASSPVPRFWLVLDEVVDPQNLGALLRSAYFLGGSSFNSAATSSSAPLTTPTIGVLVCAKNSAPPSPTVSASSAGALELLNIYSTSNLPRTLAMAEEDGFRIIGAAASVPVSSSSSSFRDGTDGGDGDINQLDVDMYDLQDLPPLCSSSLEQNDNHRHRPTLLVLGSEGHGLRNLVARSCTEFVRIPGMTMNDSTSNNNVDSEHDDDDETDSVAGVDSLNVSVTGGILLWHLLRGRVSTN
jgi:21S rRNA (GM2251-2'-O)-methyltransferase